MKLRWKSNRNSNIFIQENAFESVVCEMAAIWLGFNVLYGLENCVGIIGGHSLKMLQNHTWYCVVTEDMLVHSASLYSLVLTAHMLMAFGYIIYIGGLTRWYNWHAQRQCLIKVNTMSLLKHESKLWGTVGIVGLAYANVTPIQDGCKWKWLIAILVRSMNSKYRDWLGKCGERLADIVISPPYIKYECTVNLAIVALFFCILTGKLDKLEIRLDIWRSQRASLQAVLVRIMLAYRPCNRFMGLWVHGYPIRRGVWTIYKYR